MKITLGSSLKFETKNYWGYISETYSTIFTGGSIDVFIKKKNTGIILDDTVFEHKISLPLTYNKHKREYLWDKAREEIRNITNIELNNLENIK